MASRWAIDLGTTNTVVAMEEFGSVRAVTLPGVGRTLPVEQSPLIPSAVHITDSYERWLYFFRRRRRNVSIGQQALSRNFDGRSPAFAQSFKPVLATQPHKPLLRVGDREELTARDVTFHFLRELLARLREQHGAHPQDLTIPAPVGYFDHYRAELSSMVKRLGVKRFRSLDEPVAAALGYGVNVAREESLLVVDFGGGTLNLAVVRLGPRTAETGKADVVAKHMVSVGGNDVDHWLVEHLVASELREIPEWYKDIHWEAMFVKERVSQQGSAEFRWGGIQRHVTRDDLVGVLDRHGLYEQLRIALRDIQRQLAEDPMIPVNGVDEVLMVGGSTLLPEVPAVVDEAFPQAIVRHDPDFVFQSVALGAARYAGGTALEDFVYHDYAIAVQNEKTRSQEYELLVPRRTRYPTTSDFAVRYYADYPGMNEVRFSVCEVGRLGQSPVSWEQRPNANRYWCPQDERERAMVVLLNPADEAVPLRPPGQGASARLRVTYNINADRWLCVTVEDLVRKQVLKENEPVVRLR
ncbi:MAG: Hsp70 family protein [Armatimonadota bacterium]